MEPMEESAGDAPGRWRSLVVIDEARGIWMVEEPAQARQVWLIRLNGDQRADEKLVRSLAQRVARLAELNEPQLGIPVTGEKELWESGEIGFAVPRGRLWGDVFPMGNKMPWAAAKPWAISFARVLETAARHGMVDGSLHPGRVWLTDDGRILVPGFGLGPELDPAGISDVRQVWFSPQAVDGFPISAADDRYSVGAMVYEMVTGAAALDTNNLVYEIRYATPATPVKAGANLPAKASEAIMGCLEKDPAKRTASPAALLAGLNAPDGPEPQKGKTFMPAEFDPSFSQGASLPPPPMGTPMRPAFLRPEVWFATIVMVGAFAVGGWMIWYSWPKEKREPASNSEEALVAKNKELEAEMHRVAASKGATNGMVDLSGVTNLDQLLAPTVVTNPVVTNPAAMQAPAVPVAVDNADAQKDKDNELLKASERTAAEIIEAAKKRAADKLLKEKETADRLRTAAVAKEEAKFVDLFDGEDLKGWSGDTGYWSVQNGTLTGWIGADAAPGTVGWLVSTRSAAGDFELRGRFRMRLLRDNRAGSAALIYRGASDGRDGYHFLLGFDPSLIGSVMGNAGRGLIGAQGRMTEQPESPSARTISSALPDADAALADIRMNDWNEFRITARGDTVTHEINGRTVVMVKDKSLVRPRGGAIGLRVGGENPACVVQFKDLKLRRD